MSKLANKARKELNIFQVADYFGLEVNDKSKTLCPFHDDSTPSLVLNKDYNNFKCWPCDISGDLVNFFRRLYNKRNNTDISRRRAAVLLLNAYGYNVSELEETKEFSMEVLNNTLNSSNMKPKRLEGTKLRQRPKTTLGIINYLFNTYQLDSKSDNFNNTISVGEKEMSIDDILDSM